MKLYRLESNKELEVVNNTWLYDIDLDFTNKKDYIIKAKKLTKKINLELGTNYSYVELFGEPVYTGWCYCTKCHTTYWQGDSCYCKR